MRRSKKLFPRASEEQIAAMYSTLARTWGPQHWWPAQSRFEIIVGAFLTQNTNWSNVERALRKLRWARILNLAGVRSIPQIRLEELIRSSGYFRQKAARLKGFVKFLDSNYNGSLSKMFAQPTQLLRKQLLSLNGIGPETADSILLYAGQHPIFVVDAYTKRIAERHGILLGSSYDDVRELFERGLRNAQLAPRRIEKSHGAAHPPSRMSAMHRSPQAQIFNEMHGLLVSVGKHYCLKSSPQCDACPLKPLLPHAPA